MSRPTWRACARLENTPELLACGTEAVLYAILDAVVDGYAPVVVGLANDIDEIESQVLGGDPGVSRRIYELSREVIDLERAVRPLTLILNHLSQGSRSTSLESTSISISGMSGTTW